MTAPRRYNAMDNQRSTLSQIFEQSLQHRDVPEMIMLLGMMPLNDIKLDALTQWGNLGYDLILKIPRLQDHSAYSNFVRTYFCESCRELNFEQLQRFLPYAQDSVHLEGFLLILLDNVNRTIQVFPKPDKSISLHDLMNEISSEQSSTNKERSKMLEFMIEHVSLHVLEQVSHTLHLQATSQMYHNDFWMDISQKIQHQLLKRAAEDAASDRTNETLLKRKM